MSYLFCFILFYGFLIFSSSYSLLILLIISLYLFFSSSIYTFYCIADMNLNTHWVKLPDPRIRNNAKKNFYVTLNFQETCGLQNTSLPVLHCPVMWQMQELRESIKEEEMRSQVIFFPFHILGPVSEFIADVRIRIHTKMSRIHIQSK